MKILITGASGFLGRHLVTTAASAGHEVFALARRPLPLRVASGASLLRKDITSVDSDDLPDGLDAVVHLATGNDGSREDVCRVAVEGTQKIFAAAKRKGVPHFVHVSSLSVYSGSVGSSNGRRSEDIEPAPHKRNPYAESKVLSERRLQELAEQTNEVAVDVVRPGLVYGVDMQGALAGTAVALPLGLAVGLGRARAKVPVINIDDLSAGLVRLVENGGTPGNLRTFDILAPSLPTKSEFVELYSNLTGRARRCLWLPRWLMVSLGACLDFGLTLARASPRFAGYKIRRTYDFDPAYLDAQKFWATTGFQPRGTALDCLRSALTLDRNVRPEADAPLPYVRRAKAILSVAKGRPSAAAPQTFIVVGAGRIVNEMHVPALAALPGAQVAAVVDVSASRAQTVAAQFKGSSVFPTLADVPDALVRGANVVIATPGASHAELAAQALRRGASVLIEKPVVLTAAELDALQAESAAHESVVTVFQNYRLRPNVLRLWEFLSNYDVGAPVSASIRFHSGRIFNEAARWAHEEKLHRVLLLELAIHFFDIVAQALGPIVRVGDVATTERTTAPSVTSVLGRAMTSSGAPVVFDLDVSGTAQGTQIQIQFERAAVSLDFFPEGFRILAQRENPIDQAVSALGRLAGFAGQKLKPSINGVDRRAIPHLRIYEDHIRRRVNPEESPFALAELAAGIRPLLELADRVYGAPVHSRST